MPDTYLHGVYGELGPSQNLIAEASPSSAAYIGTLPVHLVHDYTGTVNRPVALSNFSEALRKVGYSDDWDSFTLCEAIDAHFQNNIQPVGPIYVINVLDPDTARTATKTATITFANGIALIPGDKTILKTVAITDMEYGDDFTLTYDVTRGGIVVRDLTGTLSGEVEVSYNEVTPDAVTESTIIGTADTSEKTGIQALSFIYTKYGGPPTLALAPKWSKLKTVHDALLAACRKLNGKFYVFALTDLPFSYTAEGNTIAVDNIDAAIGARVGLDFTDEAEKTAWPMGAKTTSAGTKHYHISTVTAVAVQQTDMANGGVPYESPSNKTVDLNNYYIEGVGTPLYDEDQANVLNAGGITTIVNRGGTWRLWGPHTAAYTFGGTVDARAVFDSSMRMLYYCINSFIMRNADDIDRPLSRNAIDSILNSEKSILDMHVANGALLYADIQFVPSENSTAGMIVGDFVFSLAVTTVPVIKSIKGVLSYTSAGATELSNILQEEVMV